MKQIAVLGLSRFGASVARSLAHIGVEVMGVDANEEKVEELAKEITHVVQANILDADALQSLGLRNFDVVVLSIKNVETSCLAIMKLRDYGAGYIVAQAGGEAHAKILERIGADKVIMPERDMGQHHRLYGTVRQPQPDGIWRAGRVGGSSSEGEQHPPAAQRQRGGDPFRQADSCGARRQHGGACGGYSRRDWGERGSRAVEQIQYS